MTDSGNREYKINIDPRILELLGPSLYTNIYYVLAELIANAYDASAHNVYIIQNEDSIIVEDDGTGMSYQAGDVNRYLNVAVETRTNDAEAVTSDGTRKRMGRKGVGKLAALSVSEKVLIMTRKNNEKSGFVLSRHVEADHMLQAIEDKDISFQKLADDKDGTSVVMTRPQYGMHKTVEAIKRNILKIFPLISADFKIHVITDTASATIESFDKEMVEGLGAVILLDDEFHHLADYFDSKLTKNKEANESELLKKLDSVTIPMRLRTKAGEEKEYTLEIKGWVGAYRSTRDRKKDPNDFPDNFISLLSNKKLGEYSILPIVGKNRLPEVYVVGQLHVDLFEETELPDMALSNRQGYKTDDPRYEAVVTYVRDTLLPEIVGMRVTFGELQKAEKEGEKLELQQQKEVELKLKVDEYKSKASEQASGRIADKFGGELPDGVRQIIEEEMNEFLPIMGLKKKVDEQKKRILISHTKKDKTLADVIYKMLSFNGVPDEDIIYTNCDNAECRVPNRMDIFQYLRNFFVDSYSDEKMFVIYVTSDDMAKAWGAVSEVGAGWITQNKHDIFNVSGHRPQAPLNVAAEWHTSIVDPAGAIAMDTLGLDKFVIKIMDICTSLGYVAKDKATNEKELKRYVTVT
ncbi:MAG: ATP-binding protein [Candidatus Paceibacteria bacterium]